jgi:hypothetical protein
MGLGELADQFVSLETVPLFQVAGEIDGGLVIGKCRSIGRGGLGNCGQGSKQQ